MCAKSLPLVAVMHGVKAADVQIPSWIASFPRQTLQTTEKLEKMIRDSIKSAQVAAMKAGDKPRVAALRLMLAKVKDRDIELRTAKEVPDDDTLVTEVLQKLAKQRRESIELFEQGGRAKRAAEEKAELAVIEEFLPAQMNEAEMEAAIGAIVAETGASSIKDMGRVMGELKARHGSTLDMSKASAAVKAALS
jgi:uncharacterized protein YqeY